MIFKDRFYPWIKSIFRKKKTDEGAEGVYAGPGYFDGETKKLYEGPDLDTERKPVEDVYAGPEYYEDAPIEPEGSEDLPDAPEDDDPDEQDDRPVAVLYAAPTYLSDREQTPPVMCVYAGPEYFAPKNGGEGGFAPAPVPEENESCVPDGEKAGPRCPSCGVAVPEDAPFCHICGTPLKKDE